MIPDPGKPKGRRLVRRGPQGAGAAAEPAASNQPEAPAVGPRELVRAYNRVIARAELRSIRLLRAGFALEATDDGEPGGAEAPETRSKPIVSGIPVEHRFDEVDGLTSTVFRWRMHYRKTRSTVMARAEADLLVVYEGLKGSQDDVVGRAVARLGRFASYPYFRGYVAQMSGLAGIWIPSMPIIKEDGDITKVPPPLTHGSVD